jgi:hypothetical protein
MTEDDGDDLAAAAAELSGILRSENAALEAMDLLAAGAMLAAKERALARFAAVAQGETALESLQAVADLRDLAERNRALLERGLQVQARLIGMLAQAAKELSARELPEYGASGAARARPMPAVALAARA